LKFLAENSFAAVFRLSRKAAINFDKPAINVKNRLGGLLTTDIAALPIDNNHITDMRHSICSTAVLDYLLVNIISRFLRDPSMVSLSSDRQKAQRDRTLIAHIGRSPVTLAVGLVH